MNVSTDYLVHSPGLCVSCEGLVSSQGCLGGGVGGQMLSTGGDNIGGLGGDNGAVRVSHEAGGEGVDADRVDGTTGSGVSDLGGVNLGGVGGDDGAVVVGDQTVMGGNGVGVGVGVAHEAEVGGPGGGDLEGVSGHHGAVRVGDQGLGGGHSDTGGENLQRNEDEQSDMNKVLINRKRKCVSTGTLNSFITKNFMLMRIECFALEFKLNWV